MTAEQVEKGKIELRKLLADLVQHPSLFEVSLASSKYLRFYLHSYSTLVMFLFKALTGRIRILMVQENSRMGIENSTAA